MSNMSDLVKVGRLSEPTHADTSATFSMLFVCAANRFRSPLAEHFMRAALARHGIDWTVSSAGTRAVAGEPMDENVARILNDHGIQVEAKWRSTPLTAEATRMAGVVLASDVRRRSEVVTGQPRAANSIFTILQFRRLTSVMDLPRAEPATLGPALVSALQIARTRTRPPTPGSDNIADPVGRPIRELHRCAEQIYRAVGDIADLIARKQRLEIGRQD